jgi:hypothetical protein
VIYFYGDGKAAPQFVCTDAQVQVRMDIVMAARTTAVVKELGSLPDYGLASHFSSQLIEEGRDIIGESYDEARWVV